jgi:hypothetical protein
VNKSGISELGAWRRSWMPSRLRGKIPCWRNPADLGGVNSILHFLLGEGFLLHAKDKGKERTSKCLKAEKDV